MPADRSEYAHGDRVLVTDPGLAMLRDIMRKYGEEPKPNHHGTVEEVWDDGTVLIHFDDGSAAPYPPAEVRPLSGGSDAR
jgi:hypothetical protein